MTTKTETSSFVSACIDTEILMPVTANVVSVTENVVSVPSSPSSVIDEKKESVTDDTKRSITDTVLSSSVFGGTVGSTFGAVDWNNINKMRIKYNSLMDIDANGGGPDTYVVGAGLTAIGPTHVLTVGDTFIGEDCYVYAVTADEDSDEKEEEDIDEDGCVYAVTADEDSDEDEEDSDEDEEDSDESDEGEEEYEECLLSDDGIVELKETYNKNTVDAETYRMRCPDLSEFNGMRTPVSSLDVALAYLHTQPHVFLNVMSQKGQLLFKFVTEKAVDNNTGWVAKIYVNWMFNRYALVSHPHSTKKAAKASVVTAFHMMVTDIVNHRSFDCIEGQVASFVFARIPDVSSSFVQDLFIEN